jgi:CBS domain-containing protein
MTAIRDVMHTHLVTLGPNASALDAAQRMREADIGDVLVVEGDKMLGIVTDRDLVVRCMAVQTDPSRAMIGDLCSRSLVTISADDDLEEAMRLMTQHAIRRIPVVEADKVVGIVSIGDLALQKQGEGPLRAISAASPNR